MLNRRAINEHDIYRCIFVKLNLIRGRRSVSLGHSFVLFAGESFRAIFSIFSFSIQYYENNNKVFLAHVVHAYTPDCKCCRNGSKTSCCRMGLPFESYSGELERINERNSMLFKESVSEPKTKDVIGASWAIPGIFVDRDYNSNTFSQSPLRRLTYCLSEGSALTTASTAVVAVCSTIVSAEGRSIILFGTVNHQWGKAAFASFYFVTLNL